MTTVTQTKQTSQLAEAEARQTKIKSLQQQRDKLVERLDTGAAVIEKKRSQGQDVAGFEDFWIKLLREYEGVCDELKELYGIV